MLIRIEDIDDKIVWVNPEHIISVQENYVTTQFGDSSPQSSRCGTAINLIGGGKIVVLNSPDLAAKDIMEKAKR